MLGVDRRAVCAALTVVAVGLFGEVGWPTVFLGAGVLITILAVEISAVGGLNTGPIEALWWALICWGVIGALLVSGDALASKTTLASWSAAWFVWYAVAQAGPRGRRIVSFSLMVGATLLAGSVVAGAFGISGLIANPNIVVAMIVSAAPLSSELFGHSWKGRVLIALLLIPVLMTGSRAGVLAVLAVVISLWPATPARRWVCVLGGLGAATLFAWRLISRPDSLAWHRWQIWGAIFESIRDRPSWGIGSAGLGQAMGPYRLEHAAEVGRWGHMIGGAESMPLGMAARAGLPALVITIAVLCVWVIRARRPGVTSTAILVAMAAMGLFHDFWSEPAVLWWWAAGLGVASLRKKTSETPENTASNAARWARGLAVGGIVAWAMVNPAWSQWIWWHQEPSLKAVDSAVRAEQWFSEPMLWQIETLLTKRQWTWDHACEALVWSDRHLTVRRGSAAAWRLRGKIEARIVDEFGAWPATVESARFAFRRASSLEPRLPWYPYDQALMERGLGNIERALTLAMISVELEPSFVRGWLLLARLELDAGDFSAARRALERGLIARNEGHQRAGIAYHRDLLLCPEWQLEEIKGELRQ